jgi:hypothetical protein
MLQFWCKWTKTLLPGKNTNFILSKVEKLLVSQKKLDMIKKLIHEFNYKGKFSLRCSEPNQNIILARYHPIPRKLHISMLT